MGMGRDVYVLFGHPERRRWEDARTFGFVSGGGAPVWSDRLRELAPGDRVFVHVPTSAGGPAFVGIGTVAAGAVRAPDFQVGRAGPLLDRPEIVSPGLHLGADDDATCEWLVAVDWHVAVEPQRGYWRPGLPHLQGTNVTDLPAEIVEELERGLMDFDPQRPARVPGPGTWHDESPEVPVAIERAKQMWTVAARPILEEVAHRYHSTITYQDLAHRLQDETGFRTRMLIHYWIGDVLGRVARECSAIGQPLLSALCVDSGGSVGPGYGVAVTEIAGSPPDDLDGHAALERLKCYRHFEAPDLPPDGGVPALTPRLTSRRRWHEQERARTAPRAVCPNCNLQLPLSGQCDYCG